MKTKLVAVVSAVAVSCLALILSNTAVAQMKGEGGNYRPSNTSGASSSQTSKVSQGSGGAIVATPISPKDAAKKYPPPKGGYPSGERDPHKADGVVNSPYPPRTEFDCSNIAHGALVLDTHANKVFVRP